MLYLRPFKSEDVPLLQEFLNTPEVTYFLSSVIPQPYTAEDALWWVEEGSHKGLVRAIVVDGKLVGCVGAEPGAHERCRSAEVGYWLGKPYWGKGFALRALELLVEEIKTNSDWVKLYATVYQGNVASARVLEKAGFEQEGYLKKAVCKFDRFFDARIFGKVLG